MAARKKTRILILCGGRSAEHDVSLVSASHILRHLDKRRFDPRIAYIDRSGRWLKADPALLTGRDSVPEVLRFFKRSSASAPAGKGSNGLALSGAGSWGDGSSMPDVVFPVLHGTNGEDGTVQGMLELAGLPYVGCGVLGSALGMDKEASKRAASAAGVPVVPYLVARRGDVPARAAEILGLPLFVKPARLGSSVGVSKVSARGELKSALREALRYDDKALLEKAVMAREIECAVLGDPWAVPGDPLALRASGLGEVVPRGEFYTYDAKYLQPDGAARLIPAPLGPRAAAKIRELALAAFRALDGYGLARMDFLVDKKSGKIYFNEANTMPGFTATSMYPELWQREGLEPSRLIERLIALALRRHRVRAALRRTP